MGLTDALRAAGFTPTANTADEREILKGQYKAQWVTLRKEKNRNTGEIDHILAEWKVLETLDGVFANPNQPFPHFRKRYYFENAEAMKDLCNDAFTAGVTLDTTSDEAFEGSFQKAIGAITFIRGWGWTPEEDREGNAIPEAERRTLQQFVIKQEKNVKIRKAGAAAGTTAPF